MRSHLNDSKSLLASSADQDHTSGAGRVVQLETCATCRPTGLKRTHLLPSGAPSCPSVPFTEPGDERFRGKTPAHERCFSYVRNVEVGGSSPLTSTRTRFGDFSVANVTNWLVPALSESACSDHR